MVWTGSGTETAGISTFCLSGIGTVTHTGSGTGLWTRYNIKYNTKVQKYKIRDKLYVKQCCFYHEKTRFCTNFLFLKTVQNKSDPEMEPELCPCAELWIWNCYWGIWIHLPGSGLIFICCQAKKTRNKVPGTLYVGTVSILFIGCGYQFRTYR